MWCSKINQLKSSAQGSHIRLPKEEEEKGESQWDYYGSFVTACHLQAGWHWYISSVPVRHVCTVHHNSGAHSEQLTFFRTPILTKLLNLIIKHHAELDIHTHDTVLRLYNLWYHLDLYSVDLLEVHWLEDLHTWRVIDVSSLLRCLQSCTTVSRLAGWFILCINNLFDRTASFILHC